MSDVAYFLLFGSTLKSSTPNTNSVFAEDWYYFIPFSLIKPIKQAIKTEK